jgi:hypothetical protein
MTQNRVLRVNSSVPAGFIHPDPGGDELKTTTMTVYRGVMDPSTERNLLQRLRDSLFSVPSLSLCGGEALED